MNFAETRFPEDISYGSTGGPGFATHIVTTESGHEKRGSNWQSARARYNVAHGVKTEAQLSELIAFFRARKGRAQGFRFKDWTDYRGTGEIIGTGDNSRTTFQLNKTYISGNDTYSRAITKPVSGSVSLYVDGALQSSGIAFDTTTGEITFDIAPQNGSILSADFEFDVPVRFDTDQLSARLETYGAYSWNDIPLVEIRI
jgi:uncharacterized protein (TIGR02217 family)